MKKKLRASAVMGGCPLERSLFLIPGKGRRENASGRTTTGLSERLTWEGRERFEDVRETDYLYPRKRS